MNKNIDFGNVLQVLQLAAFYVVVPLIKSIRSLERSIADLRVEMHQKFLSKDDYNADRKEE